MKTEKKILVAFVLNLAFSIFEFIGGTLSHSVAILSDSVHDFGDAISIGIAFLFEKKSKQQPDQDFTYGYARYSVIGSFITCAILFFGSVFVIYNAVLRVIHPVLIDYSSMIVLAVIGVVINFLAAFFTRDGESLNQKAVNLHMLEDVLGWVVVLIGAIVMRFTDISIIDPLMSIAVATFILIGSIKNLKEAIDLFLEKKPHNVSVEEIQKHISQIDGVKDVHHIHIWSLDGIQNFATMHIVSDEDPVFVKQKVRNELSEHNINHATLELEKSTESCDTYCCHIEDSHTTAHHHHHHH